jgi:hypothetical protein
MESTVRGRILKQFPEVNYITPDFKRQQVRSGSISRTTVLDPDPTNNSDLELFAIRIQKFAVYADVCVRCRYFNVRLTADRCSYL